MTSPCPPSNPGNKTEPSYVHGIDPMKPEVQMLCDHISIEVQCGLNPTHKFYLPFRLAQNTKSIHCPFCNKDFLREKGNYDQHHVDWFRAKLTDLLMLLPPETKNKIRAIMEK